MTTEKSELRAAVFHDVGTALDDRLEKALEELHQLRGAAEGIRTGAVAVTKLHGNVDAEVNEGHLDLAQAELAKKWVTRAAGVLSNLALGADGRVLAKQGAIDALRAAVGMVKTKYDQEVALAHPVAPQPGSPDDRHPGPPLRVVRLAEEAAERAAQAAPQDAVPSPPAPELEGEPAAPKRAPRAPGRGGKGKSSKKG